MPADRLPQSFLCHNGNEGIDAREMTAMLMARSSLVSDDETALVVLNRPGTARVSAADRYIFRELHGAAARRDTIRWTFWVATPQGVRKLDSRSLHHPSPGQEAGP